MKTISIMQPWASLIVLGHKKIETRSWNTKYRGPLLIHASAGKKGIKTMDADLWDLCSELGVEVADLPLGAILGSCNLDTLESTKHLNSIMDFYQRKGRAAKYEMEFGNYLPDRYGWLLSDIVKFDQPIPAKGKLSIWNYEPPMHHAIQHVSYNGEPSLKVINALNAMVGLAYNELEKQPKL